MISVLATSAIVPRAAVMLLLGSFCVGLSAAETLKQSLSLQRQANDGAVQSQQRIDALDDQQRALLAEYQQLQQGIALQRADQRRLQARLQGQYRRIAALQTGLVEAQRLRAELPRLNREMVTVLGEFIAADLPFLRRERAQRLRQLEQALNNAELADGEVFRRALEAWDIELEYARTLEAWRGDINISGEARTVELFRLGHVGFFYLSLDGAGGGVWVPDQKPEATSGQGQWLPVSAQVVRQLRAALDIASDTAAPQFLLLPLAAPVNAADHNDGQPRS